jgi:hypothetical protein
MNLARDERAAQDAVVIISWRTARRCRRAREPGRRTNVCSILAVFVGFVLVACDSGKTALPSGARLNELKAGYDAALEDAKKTIPYAVEFLRLFPQGATYWSYYTGEAGPPTLNMEALLYSRYKRPSGPR